MNSKPVEPLEAIHQEPIHRLDTYFLEYSNKAFINNISVVGAINEAISPLRGLSDLLCCGSFCDPGMATQACSSILDAAIKDLDYVLKKWSAL